MGEGREGERWKREEREVRDCLLILVAIGDESDPDGTIVNYGNITTKKTNFVSSGTDFNVYVINYG